MRTTDTPESFRPLGEKVVREKPRDPDWKPYRDRNGDLHPGVEVNSDGKVRTNAPLPKFPRWFPL